MDRLRVILFNHLCSTPNHLPSIPRYHIPKKNRFYRMRGAGGTPHSQNKSQIILFSICNIKSQYISVATFRRKRMFPRQEGKGGHLFHRVQALSAAPRPCRTEMSLPVFHYQLSQQRVHFDFETFHSRRLSQQAARQGTCALSVYGSVCLFMATRLDWQCLSIYGKLAVSVLFMESRLHTGTIIVAASDDGWVASGESASLVYIYTYTYLNTYT